MKQVMYQNATSQVRVNYLFSHVFDVQVGVESYIVHHCSREFRTSCSWELLYADDLVPLADTMDELLSKLGNWK